MRKAFITFTTAAFLGLAGCTTTQITDFLAQVQSATAAACMFVPTITTILAVAQALGVPTGAIGVGVGIVADAICKQVPPPASARYRALAHRGVGPAQRVGVIGGVGIDGWRTR